MSMPLGLSRGLIAAGAALWLAGAATPNGQAQVSNQASVQASVQGATVTISNFTFGPQALTVPPGTTVTWINDDDTPHTIMATDRSFRSKPLDTGERFAFTFMKPGEYAYFCSVHPMMTGKVVVKA
jgi:plastocyanin